MFVPSGARLSSRASLMRCASPPDSVVDDWPRWYNPVPRRPTSRVCTGLRNVGHACVGVLDVDSSNSAIDSPLYFTWSVSWLYRRPRQMSQVTKTSGRKFISIRFSPVSLEASQRPPLTLKLKRPGL